MAALLISWSKELFPVNSYFLSWSACIPVKVLGNILYPSGAKCN